MGNDARMERYLERRSMPTARQWRRAVRKAHRNGEEPGWSVGYGGECSPADEYLIATAAATVPVDWQDLPI